MAGRNYKDYVRSVFEPLVSAAARPDLLDELKTCEVLQERRELQFKRFATLNINKSEIVYLPSGGFVALYNDEFGKYLAVSSSGLNAQEEDDLVEWGESEGLEVDEMDESTFIFFAHELKGYYRLSDKFRASAEALDAIDIVDQDYTGHSFFDLYDYYRPVFIFKIPKDNPFVDFGIFEFAARICSANQPLRSQIIDWEVNDAIENLLDFPQVNQESIFQSLTCSQWRHVFLELYRCIEAIFYLPWILDLKTSGGIGIRAYDLKYSCRSSLQWREKERPSMEKIFSLFPLDAQIVKIEDSIDVFKDLKNSEAFNRSSLGSRLYTIRNGLVHHEDYEEPQKYKLDDNQWRLASLYMALVLARIHKIHQRDLTPSSA